MTGASDESKQSDTTNLENGAPGSITFESDPDFICTRVEAQSPDGTMIPITLSHQRGLRMDGSHPVLLHAYGAYGMCLDAGFKPERLSLLKRGYTFPNAVHPSASPTFL